MPFWLIALIVTALGGGALVFFGGSFGGSSTSNSDFFWTVEQCNERLAEDAIDADEYQKNIKENQKILESAERKGDAKAAAEVRRFIEDGKGNIRLLLKYYDNEFARDCGKQALDTALVARVEAARQFLASGSATTATVEGMPNLQVTGIQSAFVPYENDEKGKCSGPYLNMEFTVTNRGGDFPRPIDLQTATERLQGLSDTTLYFNIETDLDFGNGEKRHHQISAERGKFGGGVLKSGASMKIPLKLRVENNQTQARARARISETHFLKTGSDEGVYESNIDIPIWDISAESHATVDGIEEKKGYYFGGRVVISNKGRTPTPGPVEGNFSIKYPEVRVATWKGRTEGSVGGSALINSTKEFIREKLKESFLVDSSIILLCPDGSYGELSDGDVKNNIRELQQR